MKISRKKKKTLQRLARVHFLLTVIAFGFYLSLSFFLGPKFLLSDLKEKFHALADDIITVSARVLAPPVQPVVTATPVCVTGAPRVNLDWADDDNTITWDIERDGLPLVSGLVASSYTDATVANVTSYSYVVTAYGPMGPGFATSLLAVVTTLDCGTLQPTPTLDIVTFNGVNIATLGTLSTTALRPAFTGTTNIPNASIDILASSTQIVSDHITANGTGYWSWIPAVDLSAGDYTLSVTATDPLDGTRVITKTLTFTRAEVASESSRGGGGGNGKKKKGGTVAVSEPVINTPPSIPLDFSLQSTALSVYQGDVLRVSLEVLQMDSRFVGTDASIGYELVSPDGRRVIAQAESVLRLKEHAVSDMQITVPLSTNPGESYHIRATLVSGKYSVTRTVSLAVLPLPILQLGGGVSVTLPQVVAFSGWIALILLTLLLLWLFLFLREYWLYLHAWRHITERQLIRLGFFGTRKGVLR